MNSTKAIPITVEGIDYQSINKAAITYGLVPKTIQNRINAGWSIEEAFNLVKKNYSNIKIGSLGFKTLNRACKHFNKNLNNVTSRLDRGWTLEEALDLVERVNNSKCRGLI